MESDPWLTPDQVAERLQFHPDTVRRLLREGKIKGYQVSKRSGWRVRASDVDRFVTQGPLNDSSTARESKADE